MEKNSNKEKNNQSRSVPFFLVLPSGFVVRQERQIDEHDRKELLDKK